METTKLMQVSTRHLRNSTLEKLFESSINGLVVFKKEDYGYFIVANSEGICFDSLPSDLAYLIGAAEAQGCYYLEIDFDFPVSPNLQVFEEEEDCGCL